VPSIDSLKLNHSAVIELYTVDLTSLGGQVMRFCNWTQTNFSNVFFAGQEYTAIPIASEGYVKDIKLQFSTPTLRVSNVFSSISTLLRAFNGMVWAKVTRVEVLGKNLDGQPGANSNEMESLNVHYISAYTEDGKEVLFTLRSVLDRKIDLPRRRVVNIIS
jgi:lambda family phage minor tail protein L